MICWGRLSFLVKPRFSGFNAWTESADNWARTQNSWNRGPQQSQDPPKATTHAKDR